MSKTSGNVGDQQPPRGRKEDRYWLVWVAVGCGVATMVPHTLGLNIL